MARTIAKPSHLKVEKLEKHVQNSARNSENNVENDVDITESEENNAGNSRNSTETTEKSAGNSERAEKLLENSATNKKNKLKGPLREDTPIVPYPQSLKNKLDNQFNKFMEIFKKLHINIPFVDALEQIPSYVKFMKDILTSKRKLSNYETIALAKECSAILQRKLPQKLKDLGSFIIPCSIGNSIFEKAYVILVLLLT